MSEMIIKFSRIRLGIWNLAALMVLAVLSASPLRAQGELSIVALVNDQPISAYDVMQRLRFVSVTSRQKPTEAMRKKVIDSLINENLQLQEAKKKNIAVTDAQVNKAIDNIAKGNGMTGDQMIQALGQLGVNSATFKNRIKATMAWQQVVRRKFSRQIRVSETQVQKAMGGKSGGGVDKTEFELQRVRLKVPSGAGQAAITARLAEAEDLRKKFESCKSISSLVGRFQNATVQSLGTKTADQIKQPSRAFLLNASMGQMTPATVTSSGVELIAVCNKRAVKGKEPDKRKTVENKLRQQEFGRMSNSFIRDLRQDAYIEIR
jgi:peptidyl-prolyl cis-trans isomerase SurA